MSSDPVSSLPLKDGVSSPAKDQDDLMSSLTSSLAGSFDVSSRYHNVKL